MSGNFLAKRWGRPVCLAVVALSCGACEQMMKHSNTLVFTTNTVSGLKVGADEKQLPAVQVGHSRQELAWVPVLANAGGDEQDGDLVPCKQAGTDGNNIEACKFIGTHDGVDNDSYSTIASFGSKKGVEVVSGKSTNATVALAQYFATGIAAQYLVLTGGANVVSVGGDTKAKADAAEATAKLVKDAEMVAATKKILDGKDVALVLMGNDPDAAVTSAMMNKLQAEIGSPSCTTSNFKARGYPTTSAKAFLDELYKDDPACLLKLTPQS